MDQNNEALEIGFILAQIISWMSDKTRMYNHTLGSEMDHTQTGAFSYFCMWFKIAQETFPKCFRLVSSPRDSDLIE